MDRSPRTFWLPSSLDPVQERTLPLTLFNTPLSQDLKDFGREVGSVSFADISRDVPGEGVLEYLAKEDAERAVKDLDGRELRGKVVRVALDESRPGPDNYRRDDRRDDRRDERGDRYRDDRGYRRDRSRSPRRGSGYDDYRRGGYDDRRPADDYYYDRRREEPERRRDDRRRDDRDERYDDRATRHASAGEGGWSR